MGFTILPSVEPICLLLRNIERTFPMIEGNQRLISQVVYLACFSGNSGRRLSGFIQAERPVLVEKSYFSGRGANSFTTFSISHTSD
jgi:hypothetical protein